MTDDSTQKTELQEYQTLLQHLRAVLYIIAFDYTQLSDTDIENKLSDKQQEFFKTLSEEQKMACESIAQKTKKIGGETGDAYALYMNAVLAYAGITKREAGILYTKLDALIEKHCKTATNNDEQLIMTKALMGNDFIQSRPVSRKERALVRHLKSQHAIHTHLNELSKTLKKKVGSSHTPSLLEWISRIIYALKKTLSKLKRPRAHSAPTKPPSPVRKKAKPNTKPHSPTM